MFRHTRRFRHAGRGLALATTLLLIASFCSSFLRPETIALAQTTAQQPLLPTNLTSQQVHPGSALVAFRTPVRAQGNHVVAGGTATTAAASSDLNTINGILDGLHAKSIQHLFSNIPAATLNAARAKAEAATGTAITDFTQVYQVTFDPAINDGEAVNRLAKSSLVSSAMPNWIFHTPPHEKARPLAQAARTSVAAARAAGSKPSLLKLPQNYSYIADGQSYHDASSNNVTGAFVMLADKFGTTPGAGEIITNLSLGTIDDSSTVLENGQRYLEQTGFPKIPVWLSSQECTPIDADNESCSIVLDPTATNTDDGQGDLGEVLLDFSVMAPPPRGDARVPNPQTPDQLGEILGAAYGADFRLINPLVNGTPDFFAAWLGGAFLQNPAPTVMTASIGDGFGLGFSDYHFEQEQMIHDVVSLIVNGGDIFVTISAGDGQTDTDPAMNPNGLIGATNVTRDPSKIVDINDPDNWANPNYSYGLTHEPEYLIDSGSNSASANTLNDVFNNSPYNKGISAVLRHSQHTTETRWTGQQSYHTGWGTRSNVAAPGDNILYLEQIEDENGIPVSPIAVQPGLIGGTSAACPEVAAAAAIVRQTAKLLGHPLTARQTRDLLYTTGRSNRVPLFDLDAAPIGKVLDLTAAIERLFSMNGVRRDPKFVRMTVAQRKNTPFPTAYGRNFYTDTPQDPIEGKATIDLSQGLVDPSSFDQEVIGDNGENINAPITFAVDVAYASPNAKYRWILSSDGKSHTLVSGSYDSSLPYVRLLPAEIFGLLGLPVTARNSRTVAVTAFSGDQSTRMRVTFKGQRDATYTHAIPPSFNPLFQPSRASDKVTISYDLRGLRDGSGVAGSTVDGGVLIVSDIDRVNPRSFTDRDPDAHGFKKVLKGLVGTVTISAADLPHGAGAYGLALRGVKHGVEIIDSNSAWLPLRYAPKLEAHPATPKLLAESGFGGNIPRFYDIVDFESNGGSSKFTVAYDVTAVPGAKGALIEISAPSADIFKGLFIGGPIGTVNNFTNPYGDRLDAGNNLGQLGSIYHRTISDTSGKIKLDGKKIGLTVPAGACDNSYQLRIFATDHDGKIIGVASLTSELSYTDLSATTCS